MTKKEIKKLIDSLTDEEVSTVCEWIKNQLLNSEHPTAAADDKGNQSKSD